MYLGDYREDDTLYFSFTTRSFTTGAPTQLAGSPVLSVYKDADDTQSTTGITLAVDDDGLTGWNRVTIDASDAFYAVATDFQVVITTGTVGGVSVVGEVVAHFSIENRSALRPTTPNRELNVSAGGVADADVTAISTDSTAADQLETMLDGTGGNALSLGALNIVASSGTAVTITAGSGSGTGVAITGGSANGSALLLVGTGGGNGLGVAGGSTGIGMLVTSGASAPGIAVTGGSAAAGVQITGGTTSGKGVDITGTGSGTGIEVTGGATGAAVTLAGGGTSGIGLSVAGGPNSAGVAVAGGSNAVGISVLGNGTGHGLTITGGATNGDGIVALGQGSGEPLNTETVDQIWDEVMEGTVTARQSIRLANSANAAKLSGAATTTVVIRDVSDTKDRITATVDASGNRTAVTTDVT